MKTLEYMLHHALVTAMEPKGRVVFAVDTPVEAREVFNRLREASKDMGFNSEPIYMRLSHDDGGELRVIAPTEDSLHHYGGMMATHVYHRCTKGYVIPRYLQQRIRVPAVAKFMTPPGMYAMYGAEIFTDY